MKHDTASHSDMSSFSASPQESPSPHSPLSLSCTVHSIHTFGVSPPPSAYASHLGSPFATTFNSQAESSSNPSPYCYTASTPHQSQPYTIQQRQQQSQGLQPSCSFLDMHPSPYSMMHDLPPPQESQSRLAEAEACAFST